MPARRATVAPRTRSRITVLVASDQPILRDGLRCILEAEGDIEVVGTAADGDSAVREIERHVPRVAVLGIATGELNGIEATRLIAQKNAGVGVMILSVIAAPVVAQRALDAGALGYLSGECSGEDLASGVRSVAAGTPYLRQGPAGKFPASRHGEPAGTLTATERNILKLVAEGSSNPEVARMLGLSPRTVETYRLRLMRKLGMENLASLVRYAIRNGITPLD